MPRVAQDEAIPVKEKHVAATHAVTGRGRRHGASIMVNGTSLKETVNTTADASAATNGGGSQESQNGATGIKWLNEDLSLLHSYRSVYRLETPSAFKNPLAHLLLSQGIGKYSPTYARIKSQRRVSKDHLARAVRKNFNAMAVNEIEVIVDMLYKVKTKDKALRARFAPPRK